jgi:EAL domain-containing protein (putative c-di-GMP-specific phosphodiesterase class I)/GGDEF domain-containing protein
MLDRIKNYLPENYNYKKSEWYQKIEKKQLVFRKKLLIASFFTASLIPIAFTIDDILRSNLHFTIHYILPLFILLISLFWILKTSRTKFISYLALFLCCTGEIAGMYFPAARNVNLLVFFCFPILSFQLLGSRKGAVISAVFLLFSSALFFLDHNKILISPNMNFTKTQYIMTVVSFFLISVLIYFSEFQNESHIDDLVKNIVYDETTGLPNRIVLDNSLDSRKTSLFAIIHIANSNELGLIFGYELSDEFLLFLTRQLKKWKDNFGYSIYRLRSNEFGILMDFERKDAEEGEIILHDIWTLLQKDPVLFENLELRLNIKIGAVIVNNTNCDRYLSMADMALKAGIKLHKPVNVFRGEENIKHTAFLSTSLFTTLLKNHEENLFKAFYQPIINSLNDRVEWYELLLRICNDKGCYESPIQYLPIADSTGIGNIITDFIVEEAFNISTLKNTNISVNISFNDMLRKDLIDIILEKCSGHKGDGKIIFEILERDELSEIEGCRYFINTVREAGCMIAIDDFGSGYSNFSNLLTIPVDFVKIDGSLIRKILDDVNARNMVWSIVQFCKKSGKKVVAEFVENQAIAFELKKLNIDFLQGYHFGKPQEISYYERVVNI